MKKIYEEQAKEILNNILYGTEILIVLECEEYNNSVVAFDIHTRDSRVIAYEICNGTLNALYEMAPVIMGIQGNKREIILPPINSFGNSLLKINASVNFGGDDKNLPEAYIGYCAAEFIHICPMIGYYPEDFVVQANRKYWIDRRDNKWTYKSFPIDAKKHKTYDVDIVKKYFCEGKKFLDVRGKIFKEDLLDKFQNGNRFCVKKIKSDNGTTYSMSEYNKNTNTIDVYKLDKELFEVAKETLPQYCYVDLKYPVEVHVYAAIHGFEPLLIIDIENFGTTQEIEKAGIGTSELFSDIGVFNDTIQAALREYFTEFDTCERSLVSKGLASVPSIYVGDTKSIHRIIDALPSRAEDRQVCKEAEVLVDISNNSLYLENKRN